MSKNFLCLWSVLLLMPFTVWGQQIRVSTIDYQVLVPNDDKDVAEQHYNTLSERVKQHFKNSVSFSNQSPFYIRPKVNIRSEMTAGEVQDTKVLKLEFVFTLENPDLDVTFNTYTKNVIVTADTKELAIQKGIREIRANDKQFIAFLASGEQLINTFYSENCSKIIQSAKVKIDRMEYVAAFSLLRYIPEGLGCSVEVERIVTTVYQQYKEEYCAKQLHVAQSLTAQESYDKALVALKYIDPRAACQKDVAALLQQIGEKVNQETIRNFEMDKLIFEKRSELEKMKLLIGTVDEINLHIQG